MDFWLLSAIPELIPASQGESILEVFLGTGSGNNAVKEKRRRDITLVGLRGTYAKPR